MHYRRGMRRPTSVEVMLLSAIVLWALNLTVSRYVLTHGLQPLAYSTVRYGLASLVFVVIALAAERSLRIARGDFLLVGSAALVLFVNQIAFVYALKTTSASVIALILAATPDLRRADRPRLRDRRCSRVASGSAPSCRSSASGSSRSAPSGQLGADAGGILLGILTAATWAVYSILITPLMQRYSPVRISAVVLPLSWVGIALIGLPQTRSQDWQLGWEVWALVALRDARPARRHEHPLVQVPRPDRRVAGDARHEPAAVPRRALRGRAARRDDRRDPGRRRAADRDRDPRRAATLARLSGRVSGDGRSTLRG